MVTDEADPLIRPTSSPSPIVPPADRKCAAVLIERRKRRPFMPLLFFSLQLVLIAEIDYLFVTLSEKNPLVLKSLTVASLAVSAHAIWRMFVVYRRSGYL